MQFTMRKIYIFMQFALKKSYIFLQFAFFFVPLWPILKHKIAIFIHLFAI